MGSTSEIKFYAYTKAKLTPTELYTYDLELLGDWLISLVRAEDEAFVSDMRKLSWQTALLMNASGNLKKSVKPTDLYNPEGETEAPEKASYSKLTDEEKAKKKEELRAELLNSFNL